MRRLAAIAWSRKASAPRELTACSAAYSSRWARMISDRLSPRRWKSSTSESGTKKLTSTSLMSTGSTPGQGPRITYCPDPGSHCRTQTSPARSYATTCRAAWSKARARCRSSLVSCGSAGTDTSTHSAAAGSVPIAHGVPATCSWNNRRRRSPRSKIAIQA
ncbi:MAG TPA: DUF2690 domain-containing protein [Oceanithermus profundus]|uniref:DUF2690 domain-containing protein n=1 Tax=Oceanithermus profundus TaxID=187137 RepID=A0A7C4ZI58_9DEIN|nr:DUF2690 domain-containing protein [Oceanithermus profundus]